MLSMDLTSSGLAAGTWAGTSCVVFGAACGCGADAGAAEDCPAALKLKSVKSYNQCENLEFMVRPPAKG
jgi:hypothetical protein